VSLVQVTSTFAAAFGVEAPATPDTANERQSVGATNAIKATRTRNERPTI
jgi:hypothetical protein